MARLSQPQPFVRPTGRFLSRDECLALAQRVSAMTRGGGDTNVSITSLWTGNVSWARNQISTCGDVRENFISIGRGIRGAGGSAGTNQIDDAALEAVVRRAERLVIAAGEQSSLFPDAVPFKETYPSPTLWFDRTYQLDADARAATMRTLVQPATAAGMLSAGYLEVAAAGVAEFTTPTSESGRYTPITKAQYSVTVRDPQGTASGWAGVDWGDWGRIDGPALSAIALDKCLRSRNAKKIEPGRYTTILEPQAVCDFVAPLIAPENLMLDRAFAEAYPGQYPFSGQNKTESKINEPVLDERITISADPMDPDLGFIPVNSKPPRWIHDGVLREMSYTRQFAIQVLGKNSAIENNGAFRMSGGATSVTEMIATTKRGVLVTRFLNVSVLNTASTLVSGYTRDGLWLIENGKISYPIVNFRFTEGILMALNNVEQLGVPQRVFHPDAPVVVPPLKIKDFSFTSLTSAV